MSYRIVFVVGLAVSIGLTIPWISVQGFGQNEVGKFAAAKGLVKELEELKELTAELKTRIDELNTRHAFAAHKGENLLFSKGWNSRDKFKLSIPVKKEDIVYVRGTISGYPINRGFYWGIVGNDILTQDVVSSAVVIENMWYGTASTAKFTATSDGTAEFWIRTHGDSERLGEGSINAPTLEADVVSRKW